jgi:hypothetical protein
LRLVSRRSSARQQFNTVDLEMPFDREAVKQRAAEPGATKGSEGGSPRPPHLTI